MLVSLFVMPPARPGAVFQALGEVLERLARLRLLLAGEVESPACKEGANLGGDLERVGGCASGRELEHSGAVRVDPHLSDEPALELLRREAELQHEDRSEDRKVVEADSVLYVRGEERLLLLGEELADRELARQGPLHIGD